MTYKPTCFSGIIVDSRALWPDHGDRLNTGLVEALQNLPGYTIQIVTHGALAYVGPRAESVTRMFGTQVKRYADLPHEKVTTFIADPSLQGSLQADNFIPVIHGAAANIDYATQLSQLHPAQRQRQRATL